MNEKFRFFLSRIGERLWIKPMLIGMISVIAVFLARLADQLAFFMLVPDITFESIETLLNVIAASMLVMAVFAVGSMLAAYESASNSATPRTFALVVADDVSQNALSSFIGSFIFSIVALIALKNGYYEKGGRFTLFVLTLVVFAIVLISFLRWVDSIARLGRLGNTINKVEAVLQETLSRRRKAPRLGGKKITPGRKGTAVYPDKVGYIQLIDVATLQSIAVNSDVHIEVALLPGEFTYPDNPIAYITTGGESGVESIDQEGIVRAFVIGKERTFDEDPRFGFTVFSEIASRALSPAVNDSGTAVSIIGSMLRILIPYAKELDAQTLDQVSFDRVAVPELSIQDIFDDAFRRIARDGAGSIEVIISLQKTLQTLANCGNNRFKDPAISSARLVFAYGKQALSLPQDISLLTSVSKFALEGAHD